MPKRIQDYLGEPASSLLNDDPFRHWACERSITEDLEPPIMHYVFSGHGLELRCDDDNKISAIFMFSDKFSKYGNDLIEFPLSLNRQQVLQRFGTPSKSGCATNHAILGSVGAWDRFSMSGFAVRFEYLPEERGIKKVTYMREDVVP